MKADVVYHTLLQKILNEGVKKEDRTGTGTLSIFGEKIEFDLREGFPLLTTKKVHFKSILVELLWFIKGDTNIKYLVDNGVNIWNEWPFEAYKNIANSGEEPDTEILIEDLELNCLRSMTLLEFVQAIKDDFPVNRHGLGKTTFANRFGNLGPVYGAQWRSFGEISFESLSGLKSYFVHGTDQLQKLIERIKTNPDCRRLIVNSWDASKIEKMALPPCHLMYQCNTEEMTTQQRKEEWCKSLGKSIEYAKNIWDEELDKLGFPKRYINLMWTQRSSDIFLGIPFNIASYALLLEMIALEVNMIPKRLILSSADTHLYLNHIEQAKEQLARVTYKYASPKIKINKKDFFDYSIEDFTLENYQSYPAIKATVAV